MTTPMPNLIDHIIEHQKPLTNYQFLPKPGTMYEYVMAANGVFVRAARKELTVQIPVVISDKKIRGLVDASLVVNLPERVSHGMLSYLIQISRNNMPDEVLFYLKHDFRWVITMPAQEGTPAHCAPVNPFNQASQDAVIEVHSHGSGRAFFSSTDDKDETGFRIYVVIGKLDQSFPEILVRVGVYGHMCLIPANLVFDPFDLYGVIDVLDRISE